jgi:hypothetical protein
MEVMKATLLALGIIAAALAGIFGFVVGMQTLAYKAVNNPTVLNTLVFLSPALFAFAVLLVFLFIVIRREIIVKAKGAK